ncbi:hypothetical protein QB898_10775 [Ottowia sp. 10c7w1]|uniref:Uncharacterized protein n=1 Tax=Ottowia cancrivicina TaxID=3040346 RepID=A0AAW6RIV0_9BURK|nr:hypothetical protein [Ottowia sp. 10c7w1]
MDAAAGGVLLKNKKSTQCAGLCMCLHANACKYTVMNGFRLHQQKPALRRVLELAR